MKKECMICGNSKAEEIELVALHSDGDGNDTDEKQYICCTKVNRIGEF